MIIDANVYWLPQELFTDEKVLKHFLDVINAHKDTRAVASENEDGTRKITIEKPIGQASLDYFQNDYLLKNQLADMDEGHVDKAVLKLPGCQEWMDLDLCKLFNTKLAEYVKESNDRMVGLAAVPPYATKENLAELDRAINDLHLNGVQLSTHYSDGYLDEPAYREFLKHVAGMNIPIYVHHTPVPIEYNSIKDYENLRRSYGRCEDQIIAISREVYSDLFEELPNLKLIHSMLGGGYFTYKNMLLPHDSGNGRFDTSSSATIKERLERNILYEVSHSQPWGPDNLTIAAKVLGDKNVIYGSSYPVKKVWLTKGPNMIQDLTISEDAKENILSENAKRIYGVK